MEMKNRNSMIYLLFFAILLIYIDIQVMCRELNIIPQNMEFLLSIFATILATISALIFPIFFTNAREIIYSRRDECYVASYLCIFISGIVVSIFTVVGFFNLNDSVFKVSLIIFLDCLTLLPLYLFTIIKNDAEKVIRRTTNSIFDQLDPILNLGGQGKVEEISEGIGALEKLALKALRNCNYGALEIGVRCLVEIVVKIFRKRRMSAETKNLLIRKTVRVLKELGIACVESKRDEYARQVGKYIKLTIVTGLREKENLGYPSLVLDMEKFGIAAAKGNLIETTDEILNSLGSIGDQSTAMNLQLSPILAVLKGLQNIGIVCAEERMVHQCATTRTRIIGIARRGEKPIQEEALRRFWVVTAFMYRNIPEITEANFGLESILRREFGDAFSEQLDRALDMFHKEGEWIRKRVVREFRDSTEFSEIFAG
ncbi:MAG: hypothetical protein WBA22_07250 [Candidatus Methanofastidiosia archaeon]